MLAKNYHHKYQFNDTCQQFELVRIRIRQILVIHIFVYILFNIRRVFIVYYNTKMRFANFSHTGKRIREKLQLGPVFFNYMTFGLTTLYLINGLILAWVPLLPDPDIYLQGLNRKQRQEFFDMGTRRLAFTLFVPHWKMPRFARF